MVNTVTHGFDWSKILRGLEDLAREQTAQVAPTTSVAPPGPDASVDVGRVIDDAMRKIDEDRKAQRESIESLYPKGFDYGDEAREVLAARGVTRPRPPGEFRLSPWTALAAAGPALGALFAGAPSMALQSAGAAASGLYEPHAQAVEEYTKRESEYQKALGETEQRIGERVEKRASTLLPFYAMTADQASANARGWMQAIRDFAQLDINQKNYALQVRAQALKEDEEKWKRVHESNKMVIDVVKSMNTELGNELDRRETERRNRELDANAKAQLEINRGMLGVAQMNAQTTRMKAARERQVDRFTEIKIALAEDAWAKQDMDLLLRVLGVRAEDVSAADKQAVQNYVTLLGRRRVPPDVLEGVRQRANDANRRMGLPEYPKQEPTSFDKFLRGIMKIFFGE